MTTPKIQHSIVTYSLILANLGVFLGQFLSGADSRDPLVALEWGANFPPLTLGDDWWRLLTSMFVHYGIFHFLVNMFSLYQIGRALEKDIGSLGLIFVYLTTGLLAGLASLYWNLFVFSAGASGALFGLFGFEVTSELAASRKDAKRVRFILINFFIYISIIFFLGTQLPFDNAAHLGGLFFGIALALIYPHIVRRQSVILTITGILTSILIIFMAYGLVPRYQKTYFEIGQKTLATEKRSNQVANGEYSSDAVFIQDLKSVKPSWDSIIWSLDSLENIPTELAEDKSRLYEYSRSKRLEIEYMTICLEQESYIYFDSLEVVRGKMAQMEPLKYVFPLSHSPSDSLPSEESQPQRNIVKEYYDSSWRPSEPWDAKYYRLGYQDSLKRWDGPARDYYLNTNVQMKGSYKKGLRDGIFIYYSENNQYDAAGVYRKDRKVGKWEYFHDNGVLSQEVRHRDKNYMVNAWSDDGIQQVKEGNGIIKEYHKNGVLARHETYIQGLQDSISYGYHQNGALYFQELYEKGDLIQGISYSTQNETFNYDISTYIPQPKGGMKAFRQYEKQEKERKRSFIFDASGQVELVFSLTNDGEIFDVKVMNGVNEHIDNIAKQILLNGPLWTPGKLHGQEPVAIEGYHVISFP